MQDRLPSTIIYPETFKKKAPAGFDGVFDWSWTEGCFGETKIKPMDLDGVVERHGNILIFETKDVGKDIPIGQRITLRALWERGGITILFVYGKDSPEKCIYILSKEKKTDNPKQVHIKGVEEARVFVSKWFEDAQTHSFKGLI